MSKNAGLEQLGRELTAMPEALEKIRSSDSPESMILARVVEGVSSDSWIQTVKDGPLRNWAALPVDSAGKMEEGSENGAAIAIPVRDLGGALAREMFAMLLRREILRIARSGGSLALVTAGVTVDEGPEIPPDKREKLEEILGSALSGRLEACDSLGRPRPGQFICCLPGMGQLGARGFAEAAQSAFAAKAVDYCAESHPVCALGIVAMLPGEHGAPNELMNRARVALEMAMSHPGSHIHQETAQTPLGNATLVQSSEKRFLFFGGEAS